ncbi:arylamine N-acetyltransferase family protein [Actinoplanes xinjiangensis]|uniref:Arylamine N-acetyltransferase n=1 Tax=Actinoplanes xinjiangensis TaxID=512350 RepID=A0A316EJ59_9ACTN|nr:arylamine N-acetyltransferase [Actinoplanes xinjiangensis]PWK31191.1 arylamine N-acetyltransferase [Actinoplanes xinjiangensis]
MSDTIDVPGYLARLGLPELAGHEPSVPALRALHRAHAERVPYECLEIHLDRPTTVCPVESARRIVNGRGGYCFHLNGAFSALLRALGYQVTRHVGGVQGNADPPAGATGNHLVLTVSGLPSAESPGGDWLADLGMGDGLHGPLPLVEGTYTDGPFRYGLRRSGVEPGGWRFDHDPQGGFRGMDFRAGPARMADFRERHEELITSPESGFVRVAMAARRDATGADVLRGLTLTRIGADPSRTVLPDEVTYFHALADIFGIVLPGPDRAVLWPRVLESHERHQQAQAAA